MFFAFKKIASYAYYNKHMTLSFLRRRKSATGWSRKDGRGGGSMVVDGAVKVEVERGSLHGQGDQRQWWRLMVR